MNNYSPNNSNKHKEEQSTQITAVRKEKNIFKKSYDFITSPEVQSGITKCGDVLNGVLSILRIIQGGKPVEPTRGGTSRISYSKFYEDDKTSRYFKDRKRTYEYDDVLFATRRDAELALMELDEIMNRFGVVKVSDLYDVAHLSWEYPCEYYGWRSIGSAYISATLNGKYRIVLPPAVGLER